MKVAILAPVTWRTPPRSYGPWEQVASSLTEGLVRKGVDVTLFATGDSVTEAKLQSVCEKPLGETGDDAKVWECLHISNMVEHAEEFDIIHNHFDFLPLTYSRLITVPVITTIHGFSSCRIIPVFKKYDDDTHYVSISNADRHPELNYMATVYNGINTNEFTFCDRPEDYLLFFGRIHPEKGTSEAIEVAKRCGKKIIIAGLIQDANYFDKKIKPFINEDDVVYAGNCGPRERDKLLGHALALLHLISFDEPFGLSVAEAMCCGTPVIAFNRGAMPELILHKKTGFLVDTIDDAVYAVSQLPLINRRNCREWASQNFSSEKMTDDYISLYQYILHKE